MILGELILDLAEVLADVHLLLPKAELELSVLALHLLEVGALHQDFLPLLLHFQIAVGGIFLFLHKTKNLLSVALFP